MNQQHLQKQLLAAQQQLELMRQKAVKSSIDIKDDWDALIRRLEQRCLHLEKQLQLSLTH